MIPTRCLFHFRLSESTDMDQNAVLYQKDESVLTAVWNFSDPEYLERDSTSNIDLTWFSVGSVPYVDNIYNLTYQNITSETEANLPVGDVRPSLEGRLFKLCLLCYLNYSLAIYYSFM